MPGQLVFSVESLVTSNVIFKRTRINWAIWSMDHQMTFHLLWPREGFLADIANIIKRQRVHSFDVIFELAGGLESARTLVTLMGFLAVRQPVADQ